MNEMKELEVQFFNAFDIKERITVLCPKCGRRLTNVKFMGNELLLKCDECYTVAEFGNFEGAGVKQIKEFPTINDYVLLQLICIWLQFSYEVPVDAKTPEELKKQTLKLLIDSIKGFDAEDKEESFVYNSVREVFLNDKK